MTRGDIALHKLRGDHEYREDRKFMDPQGDEILVEVCNMCGQRNQTNLSAKWREDVKSGKVSIGTSTAYVSSSPFAFSSSNQAIPSNYQGTFSVMPNYPNAYPQSMGVKAVGGAGGNQGGGGAGGSILTSFKNAIFGNGT